VAVFLPQRLGELGVGAPILVSLYIMAWPATQSLVGLAYARLRARASYLTLLQLSALACVAAFLMMGTVDAPLGLSAATVFLGAGTGVLFSALSVLIADLVPEALLGRATAMSSTALFVGQFVSPLAIGPVMAATSIATGYIVVAGLAASILAILIVIAVKRPAEGERNAKGSSRAQGL
jgi:MFS family permease